MANVASRTAVVDAFEAVARPEILKWFPANSCIASSRIAVECLGLFGVEAVGVAATLIARCGTLAYVVGMNPREKARAKKQAGSFVERTSPNGIDGHVVAVVPGEWLIDASFDQVDVGFPINPAPLLIPLDGRRADSLHVKGSVKIGLELVQIEYLTNPRRWFKLTPAWETDHLQPVIWAIARKMEMHLHG